MLGISDTTAIEWAKQAATKENLLAR